jgi:hypothetical protein
MFRISHAYKYIAALMALVLSSPDSLASSPDLCATIATIPSLGGWQNSNGDTMQLAQNAGGQITGQYVVGPSGDGNCPAGTVYAVTGSYQGGGGNNFSLTGTYSGNNNCAHIWSTAAGQSEISGQTGCSTMVMTWNNTGGYSQTNEPYSHPLYVPSGETTAFTGWYASSQDPDKTAAIYAEYEMTLIPAYDWGGRQLTESFPSGGLSDSCYFASSKIPKLTSYPSKTINMLGDDYPDLLGVSTTAVIYYREVGKTPCAYTLQQIMSVDSSLTTMVSYNSNNPNSPKNPDNSNQHINGIDNTTVHEYRATIPSGTQPWGVPSIKLLIVPVVINPLLLLSVFDVKSEDSPVKHGTLRTTP